MRILQLVGSFHYGDAVGNDIVALYKQLKASGYETGVYAESVDPRIDIPDKGTVSEMPKLSERDVILYHLAAGTALTKKVAGLPGRKILVYHNVTPPEFFEGYSAQAVQDAQNGLKDVALLAGRMDYCLCVSEFNRQDLIRMGYTCPMDVLPILIRFMDYEQAPDKSVLERYQDGRTNLVFVGRIAPNKKYEDIIQAFYYYKKYFNPTARLFLVGNYAGMETYYFKLRYYIEVLQLTDVYFTGHVRFGEILAYYRLADVFLCMSEHEGFCVPLVEAMYFQVPIVAYASSAIPETLGGAGILVTEKNYLEIAGVIHQLTEDHELRTHIIRGQSRRLEYFDNQNIQEKFMGYLNQFLGK